MEMEKSKKDRLQDLLNNIACEAEEALFIMGHLPDAREDIAAALDRIIRVTNDE